MGTFGTETVLVSDVSDRVENAIISGEGVRSLDNLCFRILGSSSSQALYVSGLLSLDTIASFITKTSNIDLVAYSKFYLCL
jgi:hypothetical protein